MSDQILQIEGTQPPRPGKVYEYFVNTVGGLEDAVLRDLKVHLKSFELIRVEPGRRIGRILFRYHRSPARLLELRSVENLFVLLGDVGGITPGRPGLLRIARQVASCDLIPAASLHDLLSGPKRAHGFHLTCTVGRDHRFSVSELYQVVDTVLGAKYEIYADNVPAPYRLHFRIGRKRGLFGLQLSERRLGERTYQAGRSDDLNPSLAYMMCIFAGVESRDVCLDPLCTDGVPLIEAALAFGANRLISGATEARLPLRTGENLEAAGLTAELGIWRDRRMDLADESVDKVITDLRSVRSGAQIQLAELISEITRVLKPRRKAVILTEDTEGVQQAVEESSGRLQIQKKVSIYLRGQRPSVFVLRRC